MVWKYFAIDAVHIFIVNGLRYFHVHILGGCVLQLYWIPDLSDGIVQDQPRANLPFVLQQQPPIKIYIFVEKNPYFSKKI